jgi:AcrR family transcriptional regulator
MALTGWCTWLTAGSPKDIFEAMPKIQAATVEEHVTRQTARLLEAASRLFRQRGFRGTEMSDIATAMGLARNSLYRYYPNKEHILLACIKRDMGPFMSRIEALEKSHPEPRARIDAWLDMAVDIATSPAHATLELIAEIQESAPDLRQEILRLHQTPNKVLEGAVRAVLGRQHRDPALVTAMIAGMTQSVAGQAIRRNAANHGAVRRELKSSVARLLQP